MTTPPKVSRVAAEFVLRQHKAHQLKWAKKEASAIPPLFVGVQGPQGSGKSFLTSLMPELLSSPPHNFRMAALSLDDLYLPHTELTQLAKDYPDNKLLHGRGQPGTHDIPLGHKCLEALANINNTSRGSTELPVYDKSKFNGKGDRNTEIVKVEGPIDIVIFEGWATGFYSIPDNELRSVYEQAQKDPTKYAQARYGYDDPFFLSHDIKSLLQINEKLKEYESLMWEYIDCFIQLKPESMSYVWKWRLEQEHNMKAKNGGVGMSDEEVKAFIGRYMPGYELFLDGLSGPQTPWHGNGLRMVLNDKRDVVSEESF